MLKIKNLSVAHPEGKVPKWITDFSLKVTEAPCVTALIGPSGVGKTTLLKSIALLQPNVTGEILLHDRTPEECGLPNYRAKVLYVPQKMPITAGTPMDYIKFIQSFKSRSSSTDAFDMDLLIATLQAWNMNQSMLQQTWNSLSGGETQRISLAIAVACSPDVLLLDEPTSALDAASTRLIESTLSKTACIWITHSMEQAQRVAHRVLRLEKQEDGSVVVVDENMQTLV